MIASAAHELAPLLLRNEADPFQPDLVCASYDQAGLLDSGGISKRHRKLVLESSWGESICDRYESLGPFPNDQQAPNHSGREFFRHFTMPYLSAVQIRNEKT